MALDPRQAIASFISKGNSAISEKGGIAYDNPKQNIDPNILTKVLTAKEIVIADHGSVQYLKSGMLFISGSNLFIANSPTSITQLGAGGSGTPGGSDAQLQYNDGGSFAGDANLLWNKTTKTLTLSGSAIIEDGLLLGVPTTLNFLTQTATASDEAGGSISLITGSGNQTGSGGNIVIACGDGGSNSGGGGLFQAVGGGGGATNGDGGSCIFTGGDGVGSGLGGTIEFTPGLSGSGNVGKVLFLSSKVGINNSSPNTTLEVTGFMSGQNLYASRAFTGTFAGLTQTLTISGGIILSVA